MIVYLKVKKSHFRVGGWQGREMDIFLSCGDRIVRIIEMFCIFYDKKNLYLSFPLSRQYISHTHDILWVVQLYKADKIEKMSELVWI